MAVEQRRTARRSLGAARVPRSATTSHAVLAPRERRCPACGRSQRGGGRTCPNCGADLTARYRAALAGASCADRGSARARAIAAIAASRSSPALRDDAAGERERAAARQARARGRRARAADARRPPGARRRARRCAPARTRSSTARRSSTAAEALITADARARVAAGTIKGDIKGTRVRGRSPTTAARRAAEQDPATQRRPLRLRRLHVEVRGAELEGNRAHGLFGYPYWLVVDYDRAKLVWCKVTPRAGEGGRSLASVPGAGALPGPGGPRLSAQPLAGGRRLAPCRRTRRSPRGAACRRRARTARPSSTASPRAPARTAR